MSDQAFDVIVIGAGPGGMSAAVEAARAGARVVVLEALDRVGGNGSMSGAYMAFLDTPRHREAGITDSEEVFLEDMMRPLPDLERQFGTIFDVDLARRFIRGSTDAYDFLVDLGFRFDRFVDRPVQWPSPRLLVLESPKMFQDLFAKAAEELGIEVRTGVHAERLVTENGRVTGVRYRPVGADQDVEASVVTTRGGVVIATGQFGANHEMRLRYQPAHLANTPYLGVPTCTGQGHLMGQELGADMINMAFIQQIVIVGSRLLEDCIAVNLEGRRFHDETEKVEWRVTHLGEQPEAKAYYVFDDRVAQETAAIVQQIPGEHHSAGSLAELAAQMGCDEDTLTKTVEEWNDLVASEAFASDPFGRKIFPPSGQGVIQAPFHAAPMVVGALLPAGGFRTTDDMEVLNVFDETINGLYAVGDCVGGITPPSSLGGIHLTSAIVFGRTAGLAAARASAAQPAERQPSAPARA